MHKKLCKKKPLRSSYPYVSHIHKLFNHFSAELEEKGVSKALQNPPKRFAYFELKWIFHSSMLCKNAAAKMCVLRRRDSLIFIFPETWITSKTLKGYEAPHQILSDDESF